MSPLKKTHLPVVLPCLAALGLSSQALAKDRLTSIGLQSSSAQATFMRRALQRLGGARDTADALQVIRLVDRVARKHNFQTDPFLAGLARMFQRSIAQNMRHGRVHDARRQLHRLQLYVGVSGVLRDARDRKAVARVLLAANSMRRDPAAQLAASRVVAAHGSANEKWRWKEKDLISTWRDDKLWKRVAVKYLKEAERAERLRPNRLVREEIKSAKHDYSQQDWDRLR